MSDYTPTTATIRSGYASWSPNRRDVVSLALGFDRWLAEHDNAIRAENRPTVHFEDDHEECARDLAEVRMTRDAFLQYLRIAEKNLAEQDATIEAVRQWKIQWDLDPRQAMARWALEAILNA